MTYDEATAIAIELAAEYKPSYFTNIEDFEPHEWVIAAILRAYEKGFDDGVIDATDPTVGV